MCKYNCIVREGRELCVFVHVCVPLYLFAYVNACMCSHNQYGVATISRLLKIIRLFGRIWSFL